MDIRWLPHTIYNQDVTTYPGWVDVEAFPALAPYCIMVGEYYRRRQMEEPWRDLDAD